MCFLLFPRVVQYLPLTYQQPKVHNLHLQNLLTQTSEILITVLIHMTLGKLRPFCCHYTCLKHCVVLKTILMTDFYNIPSPKIYKMFVRSYHVCGVLYHYWYKNTLHIICSIYKHNKPNNIYWVKFPMYLGYCCCEKQRKLKSARVILMQKIHKRTWWFSAPNWPAVACDFFFVKTSCAWETHFL